MRYRSNCVDHEFRPMHYKRLYRIWQGMHSRCYYEKIPNYVRYGARGIRICSGWRDFSTFVRWALNNGYQEFLTLDRKNGDGHYEPDNCRWATPKQQQRNTKVNRRYEYAGRSLTLAEWSEEYGVDRNTLWYRINMRKWDLDKALNEPINMSMSRRAA